MPSLPFNKKTIGIIERSVEKDLIDRLDKTALVAHARLSAATPVDLGQARAGWTFSLNSVDNTVPEKIKRPKGHESGSSLFPDNKGTPDKNASKIGDFYSLANFVEHVVYLNEGTGPNHPTNFVETEVAAAKKDVENSL
jgi:hypothetical protein